MRHNFQKYMQYGAETKKRFCANHHTKESRRMQHTPTSKSNLLFMETPYMDLRAGPHTTGDTSDIAIVQPAEHPRTSPPGSRLSEHIVPLAYVCRSVLSREHWRTALSKLGKLLLERTRRIAQAWAVLSYYTDQLMTPCSKYFSGGSTLIGTPGGDRWARVLCGKIGWLSDPLRRVHAGCSETGSTNEFENANSWKARKKSPHPKHTMESTAARRPRATRDGMQ